MHSDETVDGSTTTVSVTTVGGNQTVSVGAGQSVEADITNTYDFVPGSLTVTKTIAGPGGGQQGAITITVTCQEGNNTATLSPPFVVPAGATGDHSYTYHNIPAGSVCTALENPDGSNGNVVVIKRGSGVVVTIPAGGTATAHITDTYQTGLLVINKTITGFAAGEQGEVVIHTVCNGTALVPDFVIGAGAADQTYQHTYPGLLAGETCTVSETSNGSTSTVKVVTVGNPDGDDLRQWDRHGQHHGHLLRGARVARGHQDHRRPRRRQPGTAPIQTSCNGVPLTPDLDIDAGSTSGQPVAYLQGHPRRLGVHGS